jgi:hypothetical protein
MDASLGSVDRCICTRSAGHNIARSFAVCSSRARLSRAAATQTQPPPLNPQAIAALLPLVARSLPRQSAYSPLNRHTITGAARKSKHPHSVVHHENT